MCRSHETLEQRGRHRDPWHGVTSAAIESDMLQKMAAEQRVFVLASIPPGRADFQTKSRRWSRGCPPRSARFRQERLPISRVAAPRTERPRSETTSPIDQRNVPLMKTFSLAPLTVLDVGPRDLIPLAAESGYRAVGIRLCAPTPGGIEYPLRPGSSDIRAIRQLMGDLDVNVSDIEVVRIAPNTDVSAYSVAFEAGAELGAKRVCVNFDDPERARSIDCFGALCDMAAPYGLALDVEFMIWRPVATLEDAVEVVRSAGRRNGFVMIDALHLFRSGGSVASVAALDPKLIGSVQLCDAPLAAPEASGIIDEARSDRLLPGKGELPLVELLDALADDIPTAAEVPLTRRHPSISPRERAKLVYAATQDLLLNRRQ